MKKGELEYLKLFRFETVFDTFNDAFVCSVFIEVEGKPLFITDRCNTPIAAITQAQNMLQYRHYPNGDYFAISSPFKGEGNVE